MKALQSKQITLQRREDKRGNLSIIEEMKDIPFEIKRTYWIYDVPVGAKRGGHAFKKNNELVIAMSGSFDLMVSDGIFEKRYRLNNSNQGVIVPAGLWRELDNFSTNAQVLVLASEQYSPDDYIWDIGQLKNGKL